MQTKHARLLFVLAIFLLSLVVTDFVRLSAKKVTPISDKQASTDVVAKVDEIGQVLSASDSANLKANSLIINQPVDNFETKDQQIIVSGKVTDPTATVSVKLNNRDLGGTKVATATGRFSKNLDLEEGLNKIVVTALSTSSALLVASVSGTLLKDVNSLTTPLSLLLAALGILAIAVIIWTFRHLKKNMDKKAESTSQTPNPPTNPN